MLLRKFFYIRTTSKGRRISRRVDVAISCIRSDISVGLRTENFGLPTLVSPYEYWSSRLASTAIRKPDSRFYPGICLGERREITKETQDGQSPVRALNPGPLKNEADVITRR
jgi:hypothetical protein